MVRKPTTKPRRRKSDPVALKLRMLEDMRARLERAAKAYPRSINSEILSRLERTFSYDRNFGGEHNEVMMKFMGQAMYSVEQTTRKRWNEDCKTVIKGALAIMKCLINMMAIHKEGRPELEKVLNDFKRYIEALEEQLAKEIAKEIAQ